LGEGCANCGRKGVSGKRYEKKVSGGKKRLRVCDEALECENTLVALPLSGVKKPKEKHESWMKKSGIGEDVVEEPSKTKWPEVKKRRET